MRYSVRLSVQSTLPVMFLFGWFSVQLTAAPNDRDQAKDTTVTIMASQDERLQISPIRLPVELPGWKQSADVQRITRDTIFDYMDGAGELYIGYRFRILEAREYESEKNGPILVELYYMESADDAFGLLSLDWGGEVLDEAVGLIGQTRAAGSTGAAETAARVSTTIYPSALFGSGLLRMRAGSIYVRMLAEQDTPATKQAIIELARAVVRDAAKEPSPPPAILATLPDAVDDYAAASTGKAFFRSHLVLNSVYFLATRNILEVGHGCEAASVEYRHRTGGEKKPRLLVIDYGSADAALKAAKAFEQNYLTKPKRESKSFDWLAGQAKTVEIEDGWLGTGRSGAFLAIVFDCPGDETARKFLNQTGALITKMGNQRREGK